MLVNRTALFSVDRLKMKLLSGSLLIPLIIFTFAFILRFVFMSLMFSQHSPTEFIGLFPDTMTYFKAAGNLLGITDSGDYGLYMTGPGYPFFLGIFAYLLGRAYWLMTLTQVILSSLSCVIIYLMGALLLKNRGIAIIAGLLAAVSLTSVSLANAALTETLFFFLFISMLYLFLRGLSENRWHYFIASGVLGGLAVLVRSVALFYPILLIILALLYQDKRSLSGRTKLNKKIAVAILLFLLLPAMWIIRNTAVYDTPTISGTGISAAQVFLTGKVLHKSQNRPPYEFRQFRDSIFKSMEPAQRTGDFKKLNDDALHIITSTFKKYPGLFIQTYFSIILENVISVSTLQHKQLPQYSGVFKYIDNKLSHDFKNPIVLVLALAGFVILTRKNIAVAILLITTYIYFALMSGVTLAQGSRIFFPALSVWPILVATSLVFIYDLILLPIKALTLAIKARQNLK